MDGVGLVVGIDRFMSEARAVTNFSGNAIATVLIAHWTKELDRAQLSAALSGRSPFDETTMLDEHDLQTDVQRPEPSRAHAPDLHEADAPRELATTTAAR